MDPTKPAGVPPEPEPSAVGAAVAQALGEAERRKDELLRALGHELRNPLSALTTSLHLLRQDRLGPESRTRTMDLMQSQVQAMATLVDELLELGRLNRGAVEMHPQVLDLGALVAATVEDHREDAHARGVDLDLELPPRALEARVDPLRFAQALGQLLDHALLRAPRGTRVAVRLAGAEGGVQVSIGREGSGLPNGDAGVFEPFSPAGTGHGATGLGLALARALVEHQGGRAWARSEDRGAALGLWVPPPNGPDPRGEGLPGS